MASIHQAAVYDSGRRTGERATAFRRYWQRRAPEAPHGGHVRIIAEPVWTGWAAGEVRARQRMGDGPWIAGQLCDRLDIHHDLAGCTIQVRVPSARAEELRQSRKY
jgi:hypothetical protein